MQSQLWPRKHSLVLPRAVRMSWLKSPLCLQFGPPHPWAQLLLLAAEIHELPDEMNFRHIHRVIPHSSSPLHSSEVPTKPLSTGLPQYAMAAHRTIGAYQDDLVGLWRWVIIMLSLPRTPSPPDVVVIRGFTQHNFLHPFLGSHSSMANP